MKQFVRITGGARRTVQQTVGGQQCPLWRRGLALPDNRNGAHNGQTASERSIGSFCLELTFALTDLSDRLVVVVGHGAASRAWLESLSSNPLGG